ncbi:nucleoid-associated protein [Clostridium felsineum]|uniref:nucleoid-associated protein n=1 Tax=Clostridium felsineum TaxID=36839 RepID=UPI00098CB124|nr:nucleoid-associated protein [Clostridium felsineum]
MEYINDVTINEAIIHILDNSADTVVFNEVKLELNDETYEYILKHIQKCFKDEELKYAVFNAERNLTKELSQEYLNGTSDLVSVSKEFATQLFIIMKSNGNIPSCDLLTVDIFTEYGPMLGILKMDYVKNYTHNIDVVDDKVEINIIPQFIGLPSSGQKIQKCAFIKPIKEENSFDLMVIDKKSGKKDEEEYGSNYFINNYLGCKIINNERDLTKTFVKSAEKWTQKNLKDNADAAEIMRTSIKKRLKEDDSIDINEVSEEIFGENKEAKEDFVEFIKKQGIEEKIDLDKQWVENKIKRTRLKIDKDIDLYINEETYNDSSRFEVKRNGDGTINMIIKQVRNYMEK